jgi:hypothetical protein
MIRRFIRLGGPAALLHELKPHGRFPILPEQPYEGQPIMLTEFGGIAIVPGGGDGEGGIWGYRRSVDAAGLGKEFAALLEAIRGLEGLAGFCYTQFADTYQEANGLLTADRTAKIPLDRIKAAVTGQPAERPEALVAPPASAIPVVPNGPLPTARKTREAPPVAKSGPAKDA